MIPDVYPRPGNLPPTAAEASLAATAPAPSQTEPVTLRIVSLDHYMAHPVPEIDVCWSELEGVAVQRVPIVRIFGTTTGGQKACLHLHGVRFSYFFLVNLQVNSLMQSIIRVT